MPIRWRGSVVTKYDYIAIAVLITLMAWAVAEKFPRDKLLSAWGGIVSFICPPMSAFDPKRTSANPFQVLCFVCPAFVPETAMRRREFISLFGSVAATWPLAARAQQAERMRRIGVLMNLTADDPVAKARTDALRQSLQQLGWVEGRNLQIDYRWTAGGD